MFNLGFSVALCFGLVSLAFCQSDPCQYTKCGYGSNCQSVDGHAKCVCPTFCPQYLQIFCGSDGKNYGNPCFLSIYNCKAKTNVTKVSDGPCPEKMTTVAPKNPCNNTKCKYGAQCRTVDGKAKCVCQFACPNVVSNFCGSDGNNYGNSCFLAVHNCNAKTNVTQVSRGPCPKTTTTTIAPPPTNRDCPAACPQYELPFCGSDGRTYGNPCFLRLYNCRQHTNVTKVSDGACPSKVTQPTMETPSPQTPQPLCID